MHSVKAVVVAAIAVFAGCEIPETFDIRIDKQGEVAIDIF